MKFRKNFIGQDGFLWWIGVVEDRNDPEKLGRCRVRIFGIHTDDVTAIPTEDLPWAIPVHSVNNNDTFATPKEGEYVIGFFLDGTFNQSPAILGVLPGYNRQTPPEGRGFGDMRDANKIRKGPKKPSALDYPEARTGHPTAISGNIINDGLGVAKLAADNIILHLPLSLHAKPSLTEENQNVIGYNHKFTQRELNQGFISIRNNGTIPINGINGANTTVTKAQAKQLLDVDIEETITQAKQSIGESAWNGLTTPQKAGLVLNAYHLGRKVDFEKSGVRSAVTSGDIIRAAQLLSAEMLKSSTGKYLRSEDTLAHIAASLFKSIPRTALTSALSNTSLNTTPPIVAGAGVGVQVHESNLSEDSDALSMKYPSPEELGKPSLSDIVTNADKTLIQKFRERTPISAIGANNESWTEPSPAYSAEYPYNKARETESGHIFEMDDTPLNERIHMAHRSGSFAEWYPSGSKVEKIVKNNYRVVMSDDHLYVAGKVNIVIESNTNVRIVGDAFLQIENDLNASVSGNVNFSVGDTFRVKANTLSICAKQLSESSHDLFTAPRRGTPTAAQKFLENDRTIRLSDDINRQNNDFLQKYLQNPYEFPSQYKNVKRYIPQSPRSGSDLILKSQVGESLIHLNETASISQWLDKQLSLASNGYWRETGIELTGTLQPSNPNIIDLWRNLGFSREYWTLSDQTVWDMAFINYGLKQNGYRYVQTPYSRDIERRFDDYRFTRIKPQDAQTGDIALWANDHVNFVYQNKNNVLSFVGGSQTPEPRFDIGDGRIGDVSITNDGGCPIVAIVRPSKT